MPSAHVSPSSSNEACASRPLFPIPVPLWRVPSTSKGLQKKIQAQGDRTRRHPPPRARSTPPHRRGLYPGRKHSNPQSQPSTTPHPQFPPRPQCAIQKTSNTNVQAPSRSRLTEPGHSPCPQYLSPPVSSLQTHLPPSPNTSADNRSSNSAFACTKIASKRRPVSAFSNS